MGERMNYVIVKQTYDLPTEAFYCDTLEEAIEHRTRLIFQRAAENSEYNDWRIYRNNEDVAKSLFWRMLVRIFDWKARKAAW